MTIPGGKISVDNTADPKVLQNLAENQRHSQYYRAFYSWSLDRWVPGSTAVGPPTFMSPNGDAYAYTETLGLDPINTRIHVVDIATGTDRVIVSSGHYFLGGWAPTGILLYMAVQGGSTPGGFVVDAATGQLSQFTSRNYWGYAAGYAWVETFDPSDPAPFEGPNANTLIRIDLKTGAEQMWLYRPGERISVIGGVAPSGVLLVTGDHAGVPRVLAVSAPGNVQELWKGLQGEASPFDFSFPDGQRTWLLARSGDLSVLESGVVHLIGVKVAFVAGPCR